MEDTTGTTGGTESAMEVQATGSGGVEAASPISSRPPAASSLNLDEYMAMSSGGGGGGGSSGGGNRWPRQETLALLRIRSEMDTVFRDATLKGPLWEDVSRKLAELGYKRSGKKCKEKFENVHKYYKRTKEGRAGRQDGKTYKFFTELEALHAFNQPHHQTLPPPLPSQPSLGVGISNPMPISSFRAPNITITTPPPPNYPTHPPPQPQPQPPQPQQPQHQQQPITTAAAPIPALSFSSNTASSSHGSEDDDDEDDNEDDVFELGEPSTAGVGISSSRKRKSRDWSSRHSSGSTMEFFENLMKQVMQKQEAMQQRFLEVIEKREQDRMIRDEAWKRQEMARLSREHELMAQERTISATRDAAIISFLQKITGQTIHLPDPPPPPPPLNTITTSTAATTTPNIINIPNVTIHHHVPITTTSTAPPQAPISTAITTTTTTVPPAAAAAAAAPSPPAVMIPPVVVTQQQPQQQQLVISQSPHAAHDQQDHTGGSTTPSSSRWPKAEVLALIKLRSGLEFKYQEAGPKGPLWEDISGEMTRMGYKRSAKRCKEKWENINKYFKKVKESNKQRPEDAKTCPYFHELDALYRNKVIGTSMVTPQQHHHHQQQQQPPKPPTPAAPPAPAPALAAPPPNINVPAEIKTSGPAAPTSTTFQQQPTDKPEDIVMELMKVHEQEKCGGGGGTKAVVLPKQQQLLVNDYDHDRALEELLYIAS
uniref:Myb-like domain-containing protein n=1 Tax=Cannabis sativa TaxID=3483 RepID=A0A803PPH6_CANSA